MRAPYHPARDEIDLAQVLYALSDPTRLSIVAKLAALGESACGRLPVLLSKSTLSHHFKVLRESGVTHTRIAGTQHRLSLRRDDLDARFPGLLDAILRASPDAPPDAADPQPCPAELPAS